MVDLSRVRVRRVAASEISRWKQLINEHHCLCQEFSFPHVGQVFRIERHVVTQKTGRTIDEVAVGVTSLSPHKAGPARIGAFVRGHWGIENRLHWVRDMAFDEDRSQIRTQSGPRMMATLRNTAISTLRLCGATAISATMRGLRRTPDLAISLILGR